jgi:REP element-mobilizing transposase RayT
MPLPTIPKSHAVANTIVMKCDRPYYHRHSLRLPEYDYSQAGIYFVTICTYQRQFLFGAIHNGKMQLNQVGKIVAQEWLKSSQIRQEIELDEWIIMPNHLHGIVIITAQKFEDKGANHEGTTQITNYQGANYQGANYRGANYRGANYRGANYRGANYQGANYQGANYQGANYQGANYQGANYQGANYQGASLAPLQGDMCRQRKPRSLSSFIGGFKSSVTRRIKEICTQPNPPVWQRNYYERVVRDGEQLTRIRQYIRNNPQKWAKDPENCQPKSPELLIDFLF